MSKGSPILPGATLGVMGGGQLGRMFALAARAMGYRVHVLDPEADGPAGQVADRVFCGAYDDLDLVRQFAESVDVVTFEFENVSADAARIASEHAPVRPSGDVLHTAQNRAREKGRLHEAGLPVTPFSRIEQESDLEAAVAELGLPAVIKTASSGYDGKGQMRVENEADAKAAWEALGGVELVYEKMIPFTQEISVVAARGIDGEVQCFEPFENEHTNHILDLTVCPARISEALRDAAIDVGTRTMQALDVVGVLCIEFFVVDGSELMINEIAPRPHNSGHLTIDACVTSQFEQQVRSICGLPLGSPALLRPAAMANLLGDLWEPEEPDWAAALECADVKLHLYGKAEARVGRKMGHLTVTADSVDEAAALALAARAALRAGK